MNIWGTTETMPFTAEVLAMAAAAGCSQIVELPCRDLVEGLNESANTLAIELVAAVDDEIATVMAKSTRFAIGYEQREAAAQAYKDAGYVGDPTIWVSRFADNVGMPYQQAADLILQQAAQLRDALRDLEALRMDKFLIAAATSQDAAQFQYDKIISAVNGIAKQL